MKINELILCDIFLPVYNFKYVPNNFRKKTIKEIKSVLYFLEMIYLKN